MRSFLSFVFYRMLCLMLFVFFAVVSHAQKVDTSFTLLWYKGKKINDTTVSKPNGVTFTYSPSQQTVTASYTAGKDPLQSYRNESARSEQAMVSMDEAIAGAANDQAPASLMVAANQAIEGASQELSRALDNSIKIKPPPDIKPTTQEKVEWLKTWPSDIAANYSAVIAYLSHPYSTAFSSTVRPPDYSYDYCYPCDAARQKKYHDDSLAFINSFLSEENLNLDRAKSVMVWLQIPKLKELSAVDSVLNVQARNNMFHAVMTIAQRIETKVVGAWIQYKNDPPKVPFMVRFLVDASHSQQVMGFETDRFPSFYELGATLLNTIMKVVEKAKTDRDYKVLLNTNNLAFLRQAEELGANPEDFITMYDFYKWHEFKVNVDASSKIEAQLITESAELHYEGIYLAYSDNACRLKWDQQADEKATDIPFNLIQIALRAGKDIGTYTGPMKYAAKRPWIRLDFCDKSRDTADFYPLFPVGGEDSWNVGRQTGVPYQVVNTVFLSGFMNEAALKKREMYLRSAASQQPAATEQQPELPRGVKLSPKDYEHAAKLKAIQDEKLKEHWYYKALYYFPVRGQLKNFSQVVFDETLDGKKISNYPDVVYATFHVKIKHE